MLSCTKCWVPLPAYALEQGNAVCPYCGTSFEMNLFPALLEAQQVLTPKELELAEGAASCFHHASKPAASCCSHCGKFLCALCSLEIGSEVWCSQCLSAGSAKGSMGAVEGRRILWDSIALGVALTPMVLILFFYFWIFTAPAAIFLSLKNWKRPAGLLPRTKIRFVLAIGIGIVQLGLWLFFAYAIFVKVRTRA